MKNPKRLNQVAVAKATGVSRATVSLVLRGGQGASESTQAKVLAAARRMGYRPNALVQSIRSGKSRTVGVLAEPHDSYWRDVCYGIHDRLIESEHLPLFLWNNDNPTEDFALIQIHRLLDRWVDGVILWPFFAEIYAQHLHEFQKRNIPLVTIDHSISNNAADLVENDEAQTAALVMRHLSALNHREVLIVSGPKNIGWADKRCEAMLNELAAVSGGIGHELRVPLGPDVTASVVQEVARALGANPNITAVAACTDRIATSVYLAAKEVGWSIPGRLSVVGVADLDFAAVMFPPLTTVRQDGYAVGRQAAQCELERSTGLLSGPPRAFVVPVTLIERSSTAPVAI